MLAELPPEQCRGKKFPQNIDLKAMAWAFGLAFKKSRPGQSQLQANTFGLAWLGFWPEAMHITRYKVRRLANFVETDRDSLTTPTILGGCLEGIQISDLRPLLASALFQNSLEGQLPKGGFNQDLYHHWQLLTLDFVGFTILFTTNKLSSYPVKL